MAARFFCDRLSTSWVPAYLTQRGFGPAVQQAWHAGYAPAAWDTLTRHLRARGCPDDLIETAGLARRSQHGTLYDTFRDRAILPIRSPNGTIAGFIGRAHPSAGPQVPKYLNSPRTCLYDKSATLFGLWEGRRGLANGAFPVIVEGPFDAIAVTTASNGHDIGLAPCGSSLTGRQAAALNRIADLGAVGILVAFDADEPGRRAAVRAYHLLVPSTDNPTAITFPAGQDPAQVLAEHGSSALCKLLRTRAHPLADLVIDEDIRRWAPWLHYPEGQVNAMHSAARLIAAMPAGHVARQVIRLAGQLQLDPTLITEVITDLLSEGRPRGSNS
jgi:DNA primase catalytic core